MHIRDPGDAIRQAWSIVITVNDNNDIHAFKVTVGTEPLFSTVKADKRSRIQDTAISAEAMLPGGPYDLWREDEASRRVKDLVSAFAENPKLPKMLRKKEIIDTIDQGVRDGIFVASLARPDKTVKTFWRSAIDDAARAEPALELFLPEKATLSELHPSALAPGAVPGLWKNGAITVADAIGFFAGSRTVTVKRDGYEEPVIIPACPAAAVEAAISQAVSRGILWLWNGPASFQDEPVPVGVMTPAARLLPPLQPLSVDQLTENALPDAWKDGQTTAYALSVGISAKMGHAVPWSVLRRAIDTALKSSWIELAPGSDSWPSEMMGAAKVLLRVPKGRDFAERERTEERSYLKGVRYADAAIEPNALQDLMDVLPAILKAAAGVPLAFRLQITLGDGREISPATVEEINKLLEEVSPELRLKG